MLGEWDTSLSHVLPQGAFQGGDLGMVQAVEFALLAIYTTPDHILHLPGQEV